MKTLFWSLASAFILIAVTCILFADLPPSTNVDLQLLQQFYHLQLGIGAGIGMLTGLVWAFLSDRAVKHAPEQSGSEFNARVAKHGLLGALISLILALVASLILTVSYPMEPLAPWERVQTVWHSFLSIDAPALAFALCLLVYALVTRARRWGGRYALLPRTVG